MDRAAYKLNHVNILVSDIEKSKKFYQEILGCVYVMNLGDKKVVLDLNGFHFFIQEVESFEVHKDFHIGLYTSVEGVHDFAKFLDSSDIPLVAGNNPSNTVYTMNETRTALYFEDPDGWICEVYSDI